MKPTNLKLTKPTYEDSVIIELVGDYNDADYTYSTTWVSPRGYDIFMPLLKSVTGRKWEDSDIEAMAVKAVEKLGYDEDSEMFIDVVGAAQEISLYGSDYPCHSMEIEAVYFECADDSIRYEVAF